VLSIRLGTTSSNWKLLSLGTCADIGTHTVIKTTVPIPRSASPSQTGWPWRLQIIAWSAVANAGISGEMMCDLMIAAVERRFRTLKVTHRLEWLSDNGSASCRQADSTGGRGPGH